MRGKFQDHFFAVRYIKDARYFSGDATLEIKKLKKPGENKKHFLQDRPPSSRKDFSSFTNLSVYALRYITLD